MSNEKKLFLLDAYALIFRSYYAFINNPMFNSKKLNTSTIFGFTVVLDEILRNQKPSHIGVVFDPPTPTFRNEIFPEYKANRMETPEDILSSVPWIKKLLNAYNIPIIEIPGYEADDVIGTLAKKAKHKGLLTYMMTPDKDFGQLVEEDIFIYKPKRSGKGAEIIGEKEIKEKYGIDDPGQVIDILALWGDTSDNVPGVPGVGEKTSCKLVQEYKSVENLINNLDNLKGKLKENLTNNLEQLKISKNLVTIRTDIDVELDENLFKYPGFHKENLTALFAELEFKTLAKRILNVQEPTNQPKQGNLFDQEQEEEVIETRDLKTINNCTRDYNLVDTGDKIEKLVNLLLNSESFCFDTETTGLQVHTFELVGLSFAVKSTQAWYVPVPADRSKAAEIIEKFRPAFETPSIRKIGQNIKFDYQVLKKYGVTLQGKFFDTLIAHYLLQPELKHNLDFLAERYLNYKTIEIEELIGKKGKNQGNMRDVHVEKIVPYACEDADITYQLMEILEKELSEAGLDDLAENIEMPLITVLAEMELNGVNLDKNTLAQYAEKLAKELSTIENEIYAIAGETFNIGSPKQLGEVLFDKLKISDNPPLTKTKQYSTSEEVLEKLVESNEIVGKILEYRSVSKLLSTYVKALPKLINPVTNRLHTSFNQAITATGRLSSNNPNLQNIPIREERGREIRKSFVPADDDHLLMAADYSQIELRLMAHVSKDPGMIDAFVNDMDIHAATASKIYDVPTDKVTREMRAKAKTANFGIIYGISAFGLSQRLNIPRSEANDLINNYFKTFPGVREYMNEAIFTARDKGYVVTMMGRKRYLRDINSRNAMVRGMAERNAINTPIQGSAADIIKLAMIKIHDAISSNNLKSSMLLQVHDELIFDVAKEEIETMKELVKKEMENVVELSVPLLVEMGIGNNWLEAH
jgi:DNA polymerase-1